MQRSKFKCTKLGRVFEKNKKGNNRIWWKKKDRATRPKQNIYFGRFIKQRVGISFKFEKRNDVVRCPRYDGSTTNIYYFSKEKGRERILTKKPRIRLSTIHKAKGGEADNVALILDCPKLIKEKGDEDSEHRVFYVGATRARKSLHIVESKSESGYQI